LRRRKADDDQQIFAITTYRFIRRLSFPIDSNPST
jgi:hypothetical protein